jgi:hypothetical protein
MHLAGVSALCRAGSRQLCRRIVRRQSGGGDRSGRVGDGRRPEPLAGDPEPRLPAGISARSD